jgi:hypothetical protein
MTRRTRMVNLSGWLKHYFKLRKTVRKFTYLATCPQDTARVLKLGAVNSAKSSTG